nr:hypothetical protein [Tanacetum cinerariifolium]
IPKTESDEFIKSSVENLVPIPSESEDFSNIESECDMPDCDDSQTTNFSMFSDPLFDNFTSSDDESSHEEFDSLLEELSGELTHTILIPPGINEANCDPKEDIHLVERLLYDNSSPQLLSNDSLLLPENESFHFDFPSSPRPLVKPPDDDEIEPDMGVLTTKVMGEISEHYVLMPRLLPPNPPFVQ